jgi:hypothetical protein
MSADPERAVINLIDSSTSYADGVDLFRGPVIAAQVPGEASPPIPQKAVFVRFASGSPPLIHPFDRAQEKAYTIDVLVRGRPLDYKGPRDDAQAILDLLNNNPPSDYYRAKTVTSHPQWIDQEDSGAHIFVVSVEYWVLEA